MKLIFYSDLRRTGNQLCAFFAKFARLKDILINQKWTYDIPGFVSHQDIVDIITNKHIIEQGEMLNGKTRMDAENYYIQTGDMRKIEELIKLLKISKK